MSSARSAAASAVVAMMAMMAAMGIAAPATAGFVDIGGGWAAEWHDSLDPFVNVISVDVTAEAVFVRTEAEFTQGQQGGVFPAIPIVFRQIAFPAVTSIVVTESMALNSTGEDWTGFMAQILGNVAAFDPKSTMQSGGPGPIGWDVSPFLSASFAPEGDTLTIGDGLIAVGETWTPGTGKDGGDLWISVMPRENPPFAMFAFKQTPLPSPAALPMMAVAALVVRRRRRG